MRDALLLILILLLCVAPPLVIFIDDLHSNLQKWRLNRKPYQKYRIIKETYSDGSVGYNVAENLEDFNHNNEMLWRKLLRGSPYIGHPNVGCAFKTSLDAADYIEELMVAYNEKQRSKVVAEEFV